VSLDPRNLPNYAARSTLRNVYRPRLLLRQKEDGRIGKEFLVDILYEHFSASEAEKQFETLVDWGRYAQLFEYDADEERLYAVEEEIPQEIRAVSKD
jgi:NitT/TauT family transport system ATP-binding protein